MSLKMYLPEDDFPWTGKRKVSPPVRVKMRDIPETHFGSTSLLGGSKQEYLQRMEKLGITPDRVYEVYEVEGFGDVADVHIKETNTGAPGWFMDNVFEDAD